MTGTTVIGNMALRLTVEAENFQLGLEQAKEKARGFEDEVKSNKLSLTDLKSGIDMTRQALEMIGQAFDATAGFAIDYGMQVKDTSALLGVNATEASTLIQVLEDLRVESGSLEMASKKLKDQGLTPNIDTLIQLSAEYQKLQAPVERNVFLFDKFGRAGIDLQRVMEAGPETLREYAEAAAESGKVVDEEFVQQMEDARLILDEFSDQVEATKIKVGVWLVAGIVEARNATEAMNDAFEQGWITGAEYGEIMGQLRRGEIELADVQEIVNKKVEAANILDEARIAHLQAEYPVMEDVADATWGEALALDYGGRAAEAWASSHQTNIIDKTGDISGALAEITQGYDAQKVAIGLIEEGINSMTDTAVEAARIRMVLLLAELEASGELTAAKAQEILDAQTTLDLIDGINQAKANGLITEYDWLGIMADGQVTRDEYNEALGITADELNDAEIFAGNLNGKLDELNGKQVEADVTVNYHSTGSPGGGGVEVNVYMAGGGSFWANSPTVLMVGEGSEDEYVQVTPKSKMGEAEQGGAGDTYYVTINDRLAARTWLEQQRMKREERIESVM